MKGRTLIWDGSRILKSPPIVRPAGRGVVAPAEAKSAIPLASVRESIRRPFRVATRKNSNGQIVAACCFWGPHIEPITKIKRVRIAGTERLLVKRIKPRAAAA